MKRFVLSIMIAVIVLNLSYGYRVMGKDNSGIEGASAEYETEMKRDLLCLMMAYPEYVKGVERGDGESVYLIMKSGRKILYDDRRVKSPEERMASPDIQDMMEQLYPISDIKILSDKDFDPGRVRIYPLLKEVYGRGKEEIQRNLVIARTPFKNLQFNKNNGAAKALENAMREIYPIAKTNPKVAGAISPISGTFNYRVISGTGLLSAHSFGIAIDLASDKRDYWKWATREQGQSRLDCYPREIVKAFENNGFVWGGKWGHFDILHFEYRPEIIYKSKYFGSNKGGKWYEGVEDNIGAMEFVRIIDEALEK